MPARLRTKTASESKSGTDATPSFRSGAVARLVGMPVATLRVWERRYDVSAPTLTASGQRLYSEADVRRLSLLKHLTERGHAIGSLAALNMQQLQSVLATLFDPQLASGAPTPPSPPTAAEPATWRVAVVGAAWVERLNQPAVLRRIGRPLMLLGVFDSAAQAAKGLKHKQPDVLLVDTPSVQPDWLEQFDKAAPALAQVKKALLYGFASEAVCAQLDSQDVALLRAPQPAAVLGQWLRGFAAPAVMGRAADLQTPATSIGVNMTSPRRWTADTLTTFAKKASSVACECPLHLAELLTRLADFENYSIDCATRGAADAQLHAYLRLTAATARVSFERAMERVALHEGLLVPAATDSASP
jgi:MerR family transcriptional regulator, light-induced transcriptional regulator